MSQRICYTIDVGKGALWVEATWKPRQTSERDSRTMKTKLGEEDVCCQLLAFRRKGNKNSQYENDCISLT